MAFRGFSIIRELELSINGIRGIKVDPADYPNLEVSNIVSYNLNYEYVCNSLFENIVSISGASILNSLCHFRFWICLIIICHKKIFWHLVSCLNYEF